MGFTSRSIALVGIVVLMGCTSMDPWDEMAGTPLSSASVFTPSARPAAQLSRPTFQAPQDMPDGQLTLAQCMKIALERNPRTRSSWLSSRAAAARVGEQRASYLPQAEFASGARRSDSVSLDSEQEKGPANTFETAFGVRYLLFDGGARSARVQGARAELLAANFRHNTVLQDVVLAVEEAYYELLAAQWVLKVAQETVRQTQYHVDLSRARHQSGLVAPSDVLKAETEKAAADLFMVRAKSAVEIARGRLASAMGLKVSQPFEVVDLPEDVRDQELANIELLLEEAAEGRPELQAALALVESKRAEVKAAQARYWPTIGTDAGYGWRDDRFVPSRDEWWIGIGASLPLFTGFDRAYRIRELKSELDKASAEYENLLRDVELEVWTAYLRVVEADQTIQASEKLVASAEESARVAEGEYKNGTGFIIELIDAQTARATARTRLVQAKLDWYTAIARFERVVGRTLAKQSMAASGGESKR